MLCSESENILRKIRSEYLNKSYLAEKPDRVAQLILSCKSGFNYVTLRNIHPKSRRLL